jgi:hypothetical protein
MKFLDKFVRTFEGAVQKRHVNRTIQEPDFVRQGSPPDERQAEMAEAGQTDEPAPVCEAVAEKKLAAGR